MKTNEELAREIRAALSVPTNAWFTEDVAIITAILDRELAERDGRLREARAFDWLCAVAQASSLHMDGTCQWRIPSHALPRAKLLLESVELAYSKARTEALAQPTQQPAAKTGDSDDV